MVIWGCVTAILSSASGGLRPPDPLPVSLTFTSAPPLWNVGTPLILYKYPEIYNVNEKTIQYYDLELRMTQKILQGLQELHGNMLMNTKVYLVCEYTNLL